MAISNSISRGIVDVIIGSLKTFVNDNRVVYEKYRVEPIQLEPRTDIPLARIALYEDSETAIAPVNAYRANMGQQTYLIDISVVRAYQGDKANRGELIALDISDMVKQWSKETDFATLTKSHVYAFEYTASSRFLRNDKYTTRTLTFVGKRDLYRDQDVPL